jgi:hypothetical protein
VPRYNVGLFLNPVSFEMATGTYDSQSSKVRVWAICRDKYSSEIAIGSIDDGSMYGSSYKQSAERTGYPRAHASPGVESGYRSQRWGTCLYVAEAETTRAHKEGQLEYKPGVTGSLDGVSSKPGTRSTAAEKWWTLAKKDGLAKSIRKCDAGQQSEIERALYLSKGDDPKLDAFVLKLSKARHKQDPDKLSKFVELRRYNVSAVYVKSKDNCDAFDILTSISCREHKLVAAACGKQSLLQYPGEPPLFWQLSDENIANDFAYRSGTTRDALLSANVGYLATEDFGRKAMENYVKIMRAVRCSDEQIRDKVALFNAKVDVTAPEYIRQEWMVQNPPAVDVIRRRRGKKVEYLMSNPKHAIVPTKIAPPRIVFYGPRPNPDALPKGVQKALERLYDRRLEAGYGALQNLP